MKRKNKLPRYWLGTRMPTSLGYQPNYGIGNVSYTSTPGYDINPETRAMKDNSIIGGAQKFNLHASTGLSLLSGNWLTPTAGLGALTAATAMSNAIPAAIGGVGSRLMSSGVGAGADYMGSMFTSGGSNLLTLGTKTAATSAGTNAGKTAASGLSSAAGTVLGGIGTAYGLADMGFLIANSQDHRTAGEMRNTLTTNTYTTDLGNTYTTHSGLNRAAELRYDAQNRTNKNINFTATAAGTGLSLGATLAAAGLAGSWAGPVGMGVGLLGGLAAYGLGFGNTEEKTKRAMNNLGDAIAMEDRMSESTALDKDMKLGFYSRTGSGSVGAAHGKQPKSSPRGFTYGKTTSMTGPGEVLGEIDPVTGVITHMFRNPGIPSTKDTIPTKGLDKPNSFAITNVGGLSDLAANGYPYEALQIQSDWQDAGILNKYGLKSAKCGKLPKFWGGTPTQIIAASVPHIGGILSNWEQLNRLKHADTSVLDEPIMDYGASNIAAQMMGDQISARPYMNMIDSQVSDALYRNAREVGYGPGGRMINAANIFGQGLKQKGSVLNDIEKYNISRRDAGRELAFKNALDMRTLKHDSWWKSKAERLQKQASLNNLMAQIPLNLYNIGSSWAGNLSSILQHDRAMNIEEQKARDLGYKNKAESDIQLAKINALDKYIDLIKNGKLPV